MNAQFTYDISTFSPAGVLDGPCAQPRTQALRHIAERMADQHRGGLTAAYWHHQASRLLLEAEEAAGEPCPRTVMRSRGVTVIAHPSTVAAAFRVELFPLFDDDGDTGSVACAAAQHPRLSVAMGEAGLRAEHWLRHQAAAVSAADERAPVIGFEATVDARLLAPLRALPYAGRATAPDRPPLRAA